jgi:nickel-dependent lactate racemase
MPSNVIILSAELEAREHCRKLTPKQILTIELRNDYNEKARLRRAVEFHKVAHKHSVKDYIKIAKRIELQEEKLLRD